MLDLLVIGAGLAGLQAAITAAQAGARVRLIAKGLSATHWAAGTVDVPKKRKNKQVKEK